MMRMSSRMMIFSATRRAARKGATADNVVDTLVRVLADMAVAVGVTGTFPVLFPEREHGLRPVPEYAHSEIALRDELGEQGESTLHPQGLGRPLAARDVGNMARSIAFRDEVEFQGRGPLHLHCLFLGQSCRLTSQ